ncbi:MAG: methyltransferase domain-containing protein [Sandaracinus sp.]|nr:methyltransferase domain-containing protein [Myxococcales bacterium]MCB9604363.1 methyltransferase domain-containing protein [Sandaracinus sp.]MCB9615490.1 methyltransferase domain-containing protein [Sandaracinus sp.]
MKRPAYRLVDFADPERERARLEEQVHALLGIERPRYAHHEVFAGETLLDVGSGTGVPARWLAAEGLHVTCVDPIREALVHAPEPRVLAAAERLPFPAGTFDVAFCRLALQHVTDPGVAVREMARVARKRVVLIDTDADTFVTFPALPTVHEARRRWNVAAEARGADPRIGRRLRALLRDAELVDLRVDAVYVTSEDLGKEAFARLLLAPPVQHVMRDEADALRSGESEISAWLADEGAFAAAALFFASGAP